MTFDFPRIDDAAERERIEASIAACVRAFYKRGLADPLLGPVLAGAIHDLETHVTTVANFWSKSLLHTERYEGHPFAVHTHLPVEPEHFARWLELFKQAAVENLPETQAEQALAKAAHMAQCFQAGMFPFKGADGRPSRTPAETRAPAGH
jgi:hemoglobin